MSASMTWPSFMQRVFRRINFLRQSRQCIELTHDANHRTSTSVSSDKRCRYFTNATLNLKSVGFGVVCESFCRLRFIERCFLKGPDLIADLGHLRSLTLN